MKFGKISFSVASLAMLVTSCGSAPASNNPFDPKTEISKEVAIATISEWETNIDTTSTYLAHFRYDIIEHIFKDRSDFYTADYQGAYSSSDFNYSFEYKTGTIGPSSTIKESDYDFMIYPDIGDGFIYFTKAFDDTKATYHYYLSNEQLSLYGEVNDSEEGGYEIVTINKSGFILYKKTCESGGGYYSIEIETVTYEKLS